MKASAVSTITKSLPIPLSVLVNYSLLADFSNSNLFFLKKEKYFFNLILSPKIIWCCISSSRYTNRKILL